MIEPKISDHYECGNGWKPLIDNVINEIISYNKNNNEKIYITQIKEKFGGLRVYTTSAPDYIDNLIIEAERESYKICENCGTRENVITDTKGWIKTLCNDCRNRKNEIKN